MGFEREGSGKYRWAGLTLPYDAAPEIYGPLVGCVLSRLRVLDDADEDGRLPVEMRQTAREFVDVWWALVDGEVFDRDSWHNRFHAFDHRRHDFGAPSKGVSGIVSLAVHHFCHGAAAKELWSSVAPTICFGSLTESIAQRWRKTRFPDPPTRRDGLSGLEALKLAKDHGKMWTAEYGSFLKALPHTRVLNEQFDADVRQVLAGVRATELRLNSERSAKRFVELNHRAAEIEFPGPGRPFADVVTALAQLD